MYYIIFYFLFIKGVYHVHYYARGKLSKKNRLKFIQLNSLQQDSLESAMQNTMNVERDHINITKRLDELTTHDLVMNIFPNQNVCNIRNH